MLKAENLIRNMYCHFLNVHDLDEKKTSLSVVKDPRHGPRSPC